MKSAERLLPTSHSNNPIAYTLPTALFGDYSFKALLLSFLSTSSQLRVLRMALQLFYISLTFSDPLAQQRCNDLLSCAAGGTVLELPYLPSSINVLVQHPSYSWAPEESLVRGQLVIPILCCDSDDIRVSWGAQTHSVSSRSHAVELAFSMTFHKVQGKTLDRVVLDLNRRPFNPKVSFTALLVAISRVRSSTHLRILPAQPGQTFDYLLRLSPDEDLRIWLSGFPSVGGVWNPNLISYSKLLFPSLSPFLFCLCLVLSIFTSFRLVLFLCF